MACAPSSVPVVVQTKPSEALLSPCVDPEVGNPTTDNDYGVLMLELARAYADCRQRHADLSAWVRNR